MAYVNMNLSQSSQGLDKVYEYEVSLSAIGSSAWILIPSSVQDIVVTISFTGGASGSVYFTNSSDDTVKTGTPVEDQWASGAVAITTSDRLSPVTAVKLTQTVAGTSLLTIKAK